jgi:two-component system nitrate/nitrite response regulator NarL
MARVLVVDRVRVQREGLAVLLGTLPIVSRVVATAPEEAVGEAASSRRPDIVLLGDGRPPDRCLLSGLHSAAPDARIIALGVVNTEVGSYVEAGCWGCIPPDGTLEELEDALHAAMRSDPPALPAPGGRAAGPGPGRGTRRLTPREQEILAFLALCLSNKQISRRLCIQVLTVKNHVHNILDKLGAGRRGEAVARMRLLRHDSRPAALAERSAAGACVLSLRGRLLD